MIVVLVAIFVTAFFVRTDFFDAPAFFGLSTDFTRETVLILAPIGGLSVPLFIGTTFLVKYINKKLADKRLRIFDAFDEGDK